MIYNVLAPITSLEDKKNLPLLDATTDKGLEQLFEKDSIYDTEEDSEIAHWSFNSLHVGLRASPSIPSDSSPFLKRYIRKMHIFSNNF